MVTRAPHAGVDLKMDLGLAVKFSGCFIQSLGLLQAENRRGNVKAHAFLFLARINSSEDQDGAIDAAFAQLDPFCQKSNTEGGNSKGFQFQGNIHETVAIGICLDHRQQAATRPGHLFYLKKIVPESG